MMREVRCCCTPTKLLGWLEWPDESRIEMRFQLCDSILSAVIGPRYPIASAVEEIRLVLDYYWPKAGKGYMAVKAEGVPLETLRRIPSFKENA